MPDPDLAFRGEFLYDQDGEPEFRLDARDVPGLLAVDVTVRVRVEGPPL